MGESGDDGPVKGEEGHEKAKQFKEDPEKMRRDKGKESRKKEERKENGASIRHLFRCFTVTENHSVHRYYPLFLVFPRSFLISFVACFEYK